MSFWAGESLKQESHHSSHGEQLRFALRREKAKASQEYIKRLNKVQLGKKSELGRFLRF